MLKNEYFHYYPRDLRAFLGFSHEIVKTKGRVIWVTKEFKAPQELRFDLHFDFLVMADRSPLQRQAGDLFAVGDDYWHIRWHHRQVRRARG